MQGVILEVPKVNREDVGGQKEVKMQLMEAVEWPQKHQDAFKRIGTRPPTGVLLFSPPGMHQRVNVTVIAATNHQDKIDPAILRLGRFDRLLYVGSLNESDRQDIFRTHLREIPCSSDVSTKELASLTEGCTGADISLICREAAVAALEESLDASEIRIEHLETAIRQVQPSEIPSYEELATKFQRLVYSSATRDGS